MTETREIVVRLQLEYPDARVPVVTMTPDTPLLYRVSEAARLLSVGVSMVNELIARNEIESVKVGAARRIPRDAVEDYVRKLRKDGGDALAS